MSFALVAQKVDARLNLPRRAEAQYESSYRVLIDLITVSLQAVLLGVCALVSCLMLYLIGVWLQAGPQGWVILGFLFLCALSLAGLEAAELFLPYYRIKQRETYGASRFATLPDLKGLGLVRPKTPASFSEDDGTWFLIWRLTNWFVIRKKELANLARSIAIGGFGLFHDLAFSIELFTQHIIVFGPPNSGKSVSFFMNVARSWANHGAAVILSTKMQLYAYTAHYYDEAYIINLIDPSCSDRLAFVKACYNNPEFAFELASLMVGFDKNAKKGENEFWPMAATNFLKALLLHLARISDRPHPAMILEFLGSREMEALDEELWNSEDEEVRLAWGIFRQVDAKTQTNIMISMTTLLEPFRSPHVMSVLAPPTDEERASGVREIDLSILRQKGKAIYVVVHEGQSSRLKVVLSTIFGLVASYLRSTGEDNDATPCLIEIDEAGNVPLLGLAEDTTNGRGRGMCYMLGYHSEAQPRKQMGSETADVLFEGVSSFIFLPGTKGKTAKMCSEMLNKTTTIQHTNVDAVADHLDNDRQSETGRELMTVDSIRQMAKHTMAICVTDTAPPIRFRFPPNAKLTDPFMSKPKRRVITPPPTLYGKPALIPVMQPDGAPEIEKSAASQPGHSYTVRRNLTEEIER